MDFTNYCLPDGRLVAVDASAAKGAAVIGFTLIGGQVVQATRCETPETLAAWRRRLDHRLDNIERLLFHLRDVLTKGKS